MTRRYQGHLPSAESPSGTDTSSRAYYRTMSAIPEDEAFDREDLECDLHDDEWREK